jgi:hypothetical protein
MKAQFYTNPNKNKDVKSTDTLNYVSRFFRRTNFFKDFVKEEGFELNPGDFKWEWTINFKNKSGFIVLDERDSRGIQFWIYKTEDDLKPQIGFIKGCQMNDAHGLMVAKVIKDVYTKNIL